jgi:LuxR family maltose regulon positive regulatory protein
MSYLRAKLLPPRPAPTLLSRPRLVDRLRANLEYPVTLVTANAGSGKTTLVADFVRRETRQFVWYQLDHTDTDPSVFLGYLTHGLAQHLPDFGQTLRAYLQQSPAEVGQHPERAVDMLLNEVLERAEQQIILVLDDYHHLNAQTPVHAMVDRLLAYLPDLLHLVLISREMPPLSLSRLHSQSRLGIVDRNDLLFNDEETQALFRQVFDMELSVEQLAEYRERTQGWITALQLVRQVGQRQALSGGERPDLLQVLRLSERDISDYFAEEVFEGESTKIRSFLLRLALLNRIEIETCSRIFPNDDCVSLLPALVRRNIFLTIASDGKGEEYRFHPLFQSFLRRRFPQEVGRAGVFAEHARLADHFLAHEQWELALVHLLEAEDFDRAAAVIAEHGPVWIASGALGSLVSYANRIPEAKKEKYPRALVYQAEALRLRGEYEAAQPILRRALARLDELKDRDGQAEALYHLATISRRQNDFTTTFSYLQRATELSHEHSAIRSRIGNTRGLCLFALDQYTEAEHEFRIALEAAEEQYDEAYARIIMHNLGLPAMMRGDFGEALRWFWRMLRNDLSATLLPNELPVHLNMARCLLYRGDLIGCEQHLERAFDLCKFLSLPDSHAEIFEAYGNLYREQGNLTRAAESYERAARAYEEAGIEIELGELWEEQALLRLLSGDLIGARALLDRLIEARAAREDQKGVHTAAIVRSRVLLVQREYKTTAADLELALYFFRERGLYYYEAQATMLLAVCDQALGRDVLMFEHLQRALELSARYDYDYWLRTEVMARPGLFSPPDVIEMLPPELQTMVAAQARSAPASEVDRVEPMVAAAPLADLTINLLGPLEIYRDPERPFALDAWVTRRAKEILCYIASRPHRRAPKERIMDIFWSGPDADAVARNFHPTISHIRKALNSNQQIKLNFLLYKDGEYLLNPQYSYRIDLIEFDRLVSESEAARRTGDQQRCASLQEDAVRLYRDGFMLGCYDPWTDEQRDYYSGQYLHLLESMVIFTQKTGEWLRSLQLAQKILTADPFREEIHCLIMKAHAAMGNRGAVKEQYELLVRLLKEELSVPPAPETQKVFRQLLG